MKKKKQKNKTIIYLFSFVFISLFLIFIFSPIVQAKGIVPDRKINGSSVKETGSYELSDFTLLLINVADWILKISGSLALLAFIIGGLMFLTSAGNKERVEQAKKILSGAIIGLIVVFFSYSLIDYVLKNTLHMNDWKSGDSTITTPPQKSN